MTSTTTPKPKILTPGEIGRVVRAFRDEFGWSQETLAELADVTSRTFQRIEAGQPSSLDTRRAVARAFHFEDTDWLNKPFPLPDEAALKAQRKVFDREHVVLDARLVNGRELMAVLIDEDCGCLVGTGLSELPEGSREAFAAALDFLQDCIDVRDVARRAEILSYGDDLEEILTPLRQARLVVALATRRARITEQGWEQPIAISILYLAVVPADAPPSKIAVSRRIRMGI